LSAQLQSLITRTDNIIGKKTVY